RLPAGVRSAAASPAGRGGAPRAEPLLDVPSVAPRRWAGKSGRSRSGSPPRSKRPGWSLTGVTLGRQGSTDVTPPVPTVGSGRGRGPGRTPGAARERAGRSSVWHAPHVEVGGW